MAWVYSVSSSHHHQSVHSAYFTYLLTPTLEFSVCTQGTILPSIVLSPQHTHIHTYYRSMIKDIPLLVFLPQANSVQHDAPPSPPSPIHVAAKCVISSSLTVVGYIVIDPAAPLPTLLLSDTLLFSYSSYWY